MRRALPMTLAILLLAAGCGGSDPAAAPDEPATATPTAAATTPAPTPTPTAASSSPVSTVIDYGDDGVTVAKPADVGQLTGAPEDFRTFIVADLARQQATKDEVCTERPQIQVAKIDVRGWAAGGSFIPQCGGSGVLWAKDKGTWREVWGGQTLPDCDVLDRYRFPATIAGGECGTPDGATRGYPA
jgi:hypothetical protein